MNVKEILAFLGELQQNNDREWFEANRKRYEGSRDMMREIVAALIDGIRGIDPGIGPVKVGDAIFRIFRDVRFSKDKSPYKTHMGAFIAKGGRKSPYPGFYIHLEPGGSFLGGGLYRPEPKILKSVRYDIVEHYPEFLSLINAPAFKKRFGKLSHMDDTLKRPPKDFPADFEGMEYLKFKSFVSGHTLPEREWTGEELITYALETYRDMAPFNAFLARSVQLEVQS